MPDTTSLDLGEALAILAEQRNELLASHKKVLAALEKAAHALEITADFIAGIHNAESVEPYCPPDSATVMGIRYDAQVARDAIQFAREVRTG